MGLKSSWIFSASTTRRCSVSLLGLYVTLSTRVAKTRWRWRKTMVWPSFCLRWRAAVMWRPDESLLVSFLPYDCCKTQKHCHPNWPPLQIINIYVHFHLRSFVEPLLSWSFEGAHLQRGIICPHQVSPGTKFWHFWRREPKRRAPSWCRCVSQCHRLPQVSSFCWGLKLDSQRAFADRSKQTPLLVSDNQLISN